MKLLSLIKAFLWPHTHTHIILTVAADMPTRWIPSRRLWLFLLSVLWYWRKMSYEINFFPCWFVKSEAALAPLGDRGRHQQTDQEGFGEIYLMALSSQCSGIFQSRVLTDSIYSTQAGLHQANSISSCLITISGS